MGIQVKSFIFYDRSGYGRSRHTTLKKKRYNNGYVTETYIVKL